MDIPMPVVVEQTDAAPGEVRLSPRLRRLTADHAQMLQAFENFPPIQLHSTLGVPPDIYVVDYAVMGLEPGRAGKPVERDQHRVEIQLTSDYPRLAPKCRMLTPVFHPNIDPAHLCVGDHWTAGERLVDLVIRIGEMLAYQAYNIKSPLDAEAAMYADLHPDQFPTDPTPLRPPGLE